MSADRANNLGGFAPDRFVAGSFNDNLLCSICRYVFDAPVLTPCGHLFCASCLSHWLTACQTLLPSCPECRRTVFAFDVRPVRGLRNYIASLPTYCSLRRHGCNTVLPLEQIQAHEEICQHKSQPSNRSNESSPNSNNSTSNARTTRTTTATRTKQQSSAVSNHPRQHTSTTNSRSTNTTSSETTNSPPSSSSSGLARSRTSGALSVHVNNTTSSRSSNHLHTATVVDHRPSARQRIAMTNNNNNNQGRPPNNSLNDRVARLEEKLQQVRLDIEAAEQRNVWLETQLALARNNLSLADALRRVRARPGDNNNSDPTSSQPAVVSRRRPATHTLSPSDD